MTSSKQKAANRANALKSTGPQTAQGVRKASLNSLKHRLSLPVSEQTHSFEIEKISHLIGPECQSFEQAVDMAKRIIDFERNEAYLANFSDKGAKAEVTAWGWSPHRFALVKLSNAHQNKERVQFTFTTLNRRPKGKERTEEIKFIEGFLKLQDKSLLGKVKDLHNRRDASKRYQRRAINQLIKGINAMAKGGACHLREGMHGHFGAQVEGGGVSIEQSFVDA